MGSHRVLKYGITPHVTMAGSNLTTPHNIVHIGIMCCSNLCHSKDSLESITLGLPCVNILLGFGTGYEAVKRKRDLYPFCSLLCVMCQGICLQMFPVMCADVMSTPMCM